MNHNTIHQINWTFIFLMISSYVILSVLLLKLFISNPNYNTYSDEEERIYLLNISDNESISDISETDDRFEEFDTSSSILISIENNYINDIDSLNNIETNN